MKPRKSYNLFFVLKGLLLVRPITTGLLICGLLLTSFYVIAAIEETIDIELSPVISFDEVSVSFNVNDYLKFETDVIISESKKVYINIEELFRNLNIKCTSENKGNNLSGFIENESKMYSIDFNAKEITIGNKTVRAANGFLKESGAIYLESTIITQVFGLEVLFNFRSLSIKMGSNFELPLLKQMRLEQMRQNVSKLQSKGEVLVDTTIGRNYHLFRAGVIDWSLSSSQSQNQKNNNKVSVRAGSELLYGEATVGVDYYSQTGLDRRQFYYNWRWVDNENPVIKQAQLGKVGVQSVAYLSAPLLGASINNSPNTIRKASGTYVISDYTEPNWTVELYINNALVDYTEADASGFYLFKVPNVYGYTTLKLKFYGPLGEERTEELTRHTPYTFMPTGTLEYNVTGGIIEDEFNSEFGKSELNYGLNRFITIGGGVEYLSSIPEHSFIPFAIVAFQPFARMVVNLEYDHNVAINGLLNYTFAKSAFLEIDYSKFTKGQQATLITTNSKLKTHLSVPFKMRRISGNAKLTYNQLVYDDFNFNQLRAVFSNRYKNLSANASIASNWISNRDLYMNATLDLSYRMRSGLMMRPTVQCDITEQELMRTGIEFEKRFSKMSLSASYTREIQYQANNVYFTLRYDLPFARTGIAGSILNHRSSISEYAQGSLALGGDHFVKAGNNSAIDKGGILFYPFLDLNQNGVKDKDEQMVLLSNVRVSGGRAFVSKKDSIVRVSDLNAFINYTVQFSDNDLDNIAWRFKDKTYQVLVDPHQYKRIYMPIHSVGEVSGMIYLHKGDVIKGLGRITVQIIDVHGTVVAETLSESDGYFSYIGLNPGEYTVRVNEKQLGVLDYHSSPLFNNFFINALVDGDIVDGIDFVLQSKEIIASKKLNNQKERTEIIVADVKAEVRSNVNISFTDISTTDEFFHTVQIGIYRNYVTADQLQNLDPIYYEVLPNGTNRYFSGHYKTAAEAKIARDKIRAKGVKEAYVLSFENGEETAADDSQLQSVSSGSPKNTDNIEAADVVSVRTNINTSFTDISTTDEFFITVQIGIYRIM
jgi:hypothetical protein